MADEILEKAQALRLSVQSLLASLLTDSASLKLPASAAPLDDARKKLDENRYLILVMGEAKRGKSSLINAIIGERILPTDVDIATCQVFRLQQSSKPGCRIRYEDDSAEPLELSQIGDYGAMRGDDRDFQVPSAPQTKDPRAWQQYELEKNDQEKRAGRAVSQAFSGPPIRWIEIEGNFPLLPAEVSLLDSPGLGSLFAEHGLVTQRFVPLADAVIFVLDSLKPAGREEVETLEKLIETTSQVFFVQTKIDMVGERWEEVRKRNEQILNENFHGRIGNSNEYIHVWPVSSKNLADAAHVTDPQLRQVLIQRSQFPELERGLRRFLFQSTGVARLAVTLQLAKAYIEQGRRHFNDQVETLKKSSVAERDELQKNRQERMTAFQREWGPAGEKRVSLERRIREAMRLSRQEFETALRPGGPIERAYAERINTITSVADAQAVITEMKKRIPEAANRHWIDCANRCDARLSDILSSALQDLGWQMPLAGDIRADLTDYHGANLPIRDNLLERAKVACSTYSPISSTLSMLGTLGLTVAAFSPFIAVIGAGFVAYNLVTGAGQLAERAKPSVRSVLNEILSRVRSAYIDVNITVGAFSPIDTFYSGMERSLFDRLAEYYQQRNNEMQQSVKQLEELTQVSVEDAQARLQETQTEMTAWSNRLREITGLESEIAMLLRVPVTQIKAPSAAAAAAPAANPSSPGAGTAATPNAPKPAATPVAQAQSSPSPVNTPKPVASALTAGAQKLKSAAQAGVGDPAPPSSAPARPVTPAIATGAPPSPVAAPPPTPDRPRAPAPAPSPAPGAAAPVVTRATYAKDAYQAFLNQIYSRGNPTTQDEDALDEFAQRLGLTFGEKRALDREARTAGTTPPPTPEQQFVTFLEGVYSDGVVDGDEDEQIAALATKLELDFKQARLLERTVRDKRLNPRPIQGDGTSAGSPPPLATTTTPMPALPVTPYAAPPVATPDANAFPLNEELPSHRQFREMVEAAFATGTISQAQLAVLQRQAKEMGLNGGDSGHIFIEVSQRLRDQKLASAGASRS